MQVFHHQCGDVYFLVFFINTYFLNVNFFILYYLYLSTSKFCFVSTLHFSFCISLIAQKFFIIS